MTNDKMDMVTIPFVSGLVSGFVSTVLFHPLDVIKTRFQVDETFRKPYQKSRFLPGNWSSSGQPTSKINLKNSRLTLFTIRKQLGFFGFYRGLLPAVIGSSVSWACYWLIYENIKSTVSVLFRFSIIHC